MTIFILRSFKTNKENTAIIMPIAFFIVSVSPKKIAPKAIAKNGVNKLNAELFLDPNTLRPV
jgi:hypothetical protein